MDDSTYTTENLDNLKALEDDTTSIKKRTKKNHKSLILLRLFVIRGFGRLPSVAPYEI